MPFAAAVFTSLSHRRFGRHKLLPLLSTDFVCVCVPLFHLETFYVFISSDLRHAAADELELRSASTNGPKKALIPSAAAAMLPSIYLLSAGVLIPLWLRRFVNAEERVMRSFTFIGGPLLPGITEEPWVQLVAELSEHCHSHFIEKYSSYINSFLLFFFLSFLLLEFFFFLVLMEHLFLYTRFWSNKNIFLLIKINVLKHYKIDALHSAIKIIEIERHCLILNKTHKLKTSGNAVM